MGPLSPSCSTQSLRFHLNGVVETVESKDANCSLNEWIRLHTRVKASGSLKSGTATALCPSSATAILHTLVAADCCGCIRPLEHKGLFATNLVRALQSCKLSCGEGGCGACAVAVQYEDPVTGVYVQHSFCWLLARSKSTDVLRIYVVGVQPWHLLELLKDELIMFPVTGAHRKMLRAFAIVSWLKPSLYPAASLCGILRVLQIQV
eukprot:1139379-Pelagomonas_calceolata.AAC.1